MTAIRSFVAGLLGFALFAATLVSFIAVVSSALRVGVGSLALPAFIAALGLEAAKVALPVAAFKLWRRGDAAPAKGVMALWCVPFAICAVAAFSFASGPQTVYDRGARDLLARKVAALKSMERTRDTEDMDDEIARGYAKRIAELNRDIAELRAKPVAEARAVTADAPAAQLAGAIAVLNELMSAAGLLLLRLAQATDDERLTPKPPVPVAEVLNNTDEPLLLPQGGPAFIEASAKVDPSKAAAWLFPGVLPLGALTLLSGQPKTGKSTIAVDFAATVSAGGRWPTGATLAEPGGAILCEVEDSFADTQARLLAAGADLGRIAIRDRESGPLDLSTAEGMAVLAGQAAAMGGVRLVALSPLLAFFGRAGATDDATVRARLSRLLLWAAQNRIAVLGLLHPVKNAGRSLDSQFAGADAYRRAARSAFVAMPDASDPEPVVKRKRRVLVCAGVNGASDDFRLFYRIEGAAIGSQATSRVRWLTNVEEEDAETEVDPEFKGVDRGLHPGDSEESCLENETLEEDRLARGGQTQAARACRFLIQALADGPRLGAELKAEAAELGIPGSTLDRAADLFLGVIKEGSGPKKAKTWRLPNSQIPTGIGPDGPLTP